MKLPALPALIGVAHWWRRFSRRDGGSISAEYVMASAIVVGLGAAASITIGIGARDAGDNVATSLQTSTSSTETPQDRPGGRGDPDRPGRPSWVDDRLDDRPIRPVRPGIPDFDTRTTPDDLPTGLPGRPVSGNDDEDQEDNDADDDQ